MEAFASRCRRLANSPRFQNAVLGLIAGNAALMGVETSAGLMASYGAVFAALKSHVRLRFPGPDPWPLATPQEGQSGHAALRW